MKEFDLLSFKLELADLLDKFGIEALEYDYISESYYLDFHDSTISLNKYYLTPKNLRNDKTKTKN